MPNAIDRNALNREERALASLDHAQRKYNECAAARGYANTINANYNNMTNVV